MAEAELVKKVAHKAEVSKKDARQLVDIVFDSIIEPFNTADSNPVELDEALIHKSLKEYFAKRHQKMRDVSKTRGNVRHKHWKQKGIGRARIASLRSPLWKGFNNVSESKPVLKTHKFLRKRLLETAISEISDNEIVGEFNSLAEIWYRDTLHSSAYLDKILHSAYQRIIGLGKDVIPFILRELQDEPLEWFWALRALTGEDPTTTEMAGKRDEMAKAWLDWGKEKGFI